MEKIKALVIDDSKNARETLSKHLNKYCPAVNVIGLSEDAESAYESMMELDVDLIFLDIEMPGDTGFDLLNKINSDQLQIIFTTAYEEYAIQAINKGAIGYLVKPISIDELIIVVNRAIKTNKKRKKPKANILLSDMYGYEMLNFETIIYCESKNSYTVFYTNLGQEKIISKGLKEIENKLADDCFFRVHNSFIVNKKFVKRYNVKDGYSIETTSGATIPVSRRRNNAVKVWLEGI